MRDTPHDSPAVASRPGVMLDPDRLNDLAADHTRRDAESAMPLPATSGDIVLARHGEPALSRK